MRAPRHAADDKSPFAKIPPPCPYFGTCGGCTLQDLAYPDQVALKQERLRRVLSALGEVPPVELVPLEDPWRYRNKAEFSFGAQEQAVQLGFHVAGSFVKIVDLDDCLLLPEPLMAVVRTARTLAVQTQLPVYHPRTHQGVLRYLLARHSGLTGQQLLCLVTAPADRALIERWAASLRQQHPTVGSLYWGVTERLADVAVPEELILLGGDGTFEDQIGPFRLALHPFSFLQSSGRQAHRLYATLMDWLPEQPKGTAWDLYCGVGIIALYLAGRFGQVYGIDSEAHHIALAKRNAERNGITNVKFKAGKTEDVLGDRRFWLAEAKPDVVVVDPPRAGLHAQALDSLLAARPARIGYISCNAAALVRDVQRLAASYPRYRLTKLAAFDMFPQTNHIETVALLER